MPIIFANRSEAGRLLARELLKHRWRRAVVLAVPRGGVLVGVEVALALQAPIDLLMVGTIGGARHPELAVAAIALGAGSEPVLDVEAMESTRTYRAYVEARARAELREAERRRLVVLGKQEPVSLTGKTAIIVDDGLGSGTTARAALQAVRARRPARLVLAVPVASPAAVAAVTPEVDALFCLAQPSPFGSVGVHYADFHQLSDAEMMTGIARTQRGV